MLTSFASKCVSSQKCKGGHNGPGHNGPPNLTIVKMFLYQNLSNQEQLKKNIYEALILSVKSFSVSKLCKYSSWKIRQKLSEKKENF